ncbi:MAG: electron transfer flavoprotein subunit beta/FixA family protein [Bacteroidales bacterium]|jgi:electron transfer flavoprotein beta subunit|nr:electron transfer flavoprotein subunit beta/FixA family protein [Bacteroidales bacterium]
MYNNKIFNIVVLAKQVPDTRNVGKDAMKEDGTVNRAALPAIFNPEDLSALEMALTIKDKLLENCKITVITMGPVRAADIIREALYRGADQGVVLSDRKFAGSDTLATSYALALAVKKTGHFDLVIAGRQAIDGDTAQVGPQIAEKLNLPQITYSEEIMNITDTRVRVKRRLERGIEIVEAPFPCLLTVHGSAAPCRARNAKKLMKYKHAKTPSELAEPGTENQSRYSQKPFLNIEEWTADHVNAIPERLGLSGSPTKVKKIENVVLVKKESQNINPNEEGIHLLIRELVNTRVIG